MKKIIIILAVVVTLTMLSYSTFATNVSGGIYVNTTWTLANSPYIVTDTLVVFPGVTLTIEPGVVVKFDNNIYLEIRDANIIAQGTSVDSITFTSNSGVPVHGIWGGVRNTGTAFSNAHVFNCCNFRYATNGLNNNYNGVADTLIIKNSNFNNNNTGLFGVNGGYVVIDSNSFNNNFTCGFDFSGNNSIVVNYCNFSNNALGITNSFHSTFLNCTFRSNTTAIYYAQNCKIYSCIINNNQNGLTPLGGSYNRIKNCTIDSNVVWGAKLSSGDSIINCHVNYNTTGIISQATQNTIIMCTIENNGTGIIVAYYNATIYCNKICNNTNYGLSYTGVPNLSFPNNYWCTTDSASTSAVIHDGYDNVIYGLINFMPLDTVSCYLTGCNLHITSTVTNATCASCPNGSAAATIINGMPPYTYTWYTIPMQTTQTATGLPSGMYTVCVTDANGCSTCDSVFVDSTNCTGFYVTTTSTNATCSSCNDGTAMAIPSGGSVPYNYTWYTIPMQTTASASALGFGTYGVCVTDANGCTACDSATINIGNCSAHFSFYADTIPQNYIAINMASGAMPLTYLWSWGDGTYDSTAYPSHTYATSGFYNICLTITDSVGCTNTYCSSYYLMMPQTPIIHVNVYPPGGIFVGINNKTKEETITIAPNPFTSQTTISFSEEFRNNGTGSQHTIKIMNLVGECIQQLTTNNKQLILDMSNVAKGIYFVRIEDTSAGSVTENKKVVNRKIIKN